MASYFVEAPIEYTPDHHRYWSSMQGLRVAVKAVNLEFPFREANKVVADLAFHKLEVIASQLVLGGSDRESWLKEKEKTISAALVEAQRGNYQPVLDHVWGDISRLAASNNDYSTEFDCNGFDKDDLIIGFERVINMAQPIGIRYVSPQHSWDNPQMLVDYVERNRGRNDK